MKEPTIPKRLTVEALRKWLDDYEATWTETDIEYLGEFKDIPIRVFNDTADGGGVTDSQPMYDGGLGIILLPVKYIKDE